VDLSERGFGAGLIPVLHVIRAPYGSVKAVDAITRVHRSRLIPSDAADSRASRDSINRLVRVYAYKSYWRTPHLFYNQLKISHLRE